MISLCYSCGSPSEGTSYMLTGKDGTIRLVPVCLNCESRRRQEGRTLRTGQDLIADRAAHHPNPDSPTFGTIIRPARRAAADQLDEGRPPRRAT